MFEHVICPKCGAQNPEETAYCGKCGERIAGLTAGASKADPLIGTLVGDRFLVHEKLGEGGMGVVYRAEQTAIKRKVALKVLHSQLTQDESLHARFHNEAEAASRLTHPNTVTIYDFGKTTGGSLYIAMEFIEGKSLDDEIKEKGPMELGRVVRIVDQICGSLSDAHDHNIVHRDLKPENIMLCTRGGQSDVVKVLDFGIAKVMEDNGKDQRKALTKTGMVFGTPQYMSPEQIRGEKVDNRTDIYSLGVIVYQMITGKLPFTADTPMGALSKHLVEAPPTFVEINKDVKIPPAVEGLVMAALAKNAADRPQKMKNFFDELSNAVANSGHMTAKIAAGSTTPTAATPAPGKSRKSTSSKTGSKSSQKSASELQPSKKNKHLFIGIAVAALLVVSAVTAWQVLTRMKKSDTTDQPTITYQTPPVQPTVQPQVVPQPVTQSSTQQPETGNSQPIVQPTDPLPSIPDEKETDNSNKETGSKQPKEAKCIALPDLTGDAVVGAMLSNLKTNQKKIKECAALGAEGKTAFTFEVLKDKSNPTNIRYASSGTTETNNEVKSCLRGVLGADFGTSADKRRSGSAAFELKYKNKFVTQCRFAVAAQPMNEPEPKPEPKPEVKPKPKPGKVSPIRAIIRKKLK